MAKIKVFELAKEVDKQSKDVIGFLQNAGVDVKAAQSSVEDDAADMVRTAFGRKTAEAAAFGNKGGAAAGAESAPKTGTPEKTAAPKQDAAKSDAQKKNPSGQNAPRQNAPQQNAPKKKKTIIFVSNPQNSKMSGSRPGGGQRPQGSGNRGYANGRYQTPNRPIKPLTPPSPTPSVQMVDSKPQQPKRPAENVNPPRQAETKPAGAAETAACANRTQQQQPVRQPERSEQVTEQPARQSERPVHQPDRPSHQSNRPARQSDRPAREGGYNSGARSQDNRGRDFRGGQRPQGGQYQGRDARPGQGGRPQGGSTYGGGERSGQGGYNRQGRPGYGGQNERRGTGAAPGRGFGGGRDARGSGQGGRGGYGAAPSDGMDKKRDDSRRSARERDNKRSSKKDHIYEEDEARRNRPGRFIKPEKKEEAEEVIKVITLPETITLKELAEKMKMQPAVIIKKLFLDGKVVTMNQELSYEDAENIAMEYEILCEREVKVDVIEELLKEEEEPEENLVERPPVICVMGHVDHGKTSLLDAVRKTHVTDREAGGITQHIGAYTVTLGERKITFLDTPGHEAFTAMRMRGANSTDIAVLVVAADDGVMPQTIEAINHAKAAGIEIVVAVNKIDKPSANVERVKQELTEYDLVATDWGGNTEFVPVSAKTGEGISNLLETILLTADILELKANPNRRARGLVIEAKLDKGRGPVANILVQKGTLHVGDFVSAGACSGKVRAMIDDKGRSVKSAGPSMPVEVLGLNDVPAAGEVIIAHDTDKEAKSYADTYKAQYKEKKLEETKSRMSLDDLFSQIQEGNLKELNLIIKADVQGSVEAVKTSLLKLSNDEVVVKCIHGGVGAITESDVALASASNAIIIGFNVRPDASAKETAEHEGVDVRLYKVIYQAIEDVEAAMKGMLDPVFEEKIIGHAEVRQIFKASKVGNIAGSYVTDGEVQRDCKVRITRAGEQIYEGTLTSLKRFKDDAKEVKAGYECGLVFDGFDQMQELDIVEAYIMVEVPRS